MYKIIFFHDKSHNRHTELEERWTNQIPQLHTDIQNILTYRNSKLELEERCTNQIPLTLHYTTDIKVKFGAGGTVLKPDTSTLHYRHEDIPIVKRKSNLELEERCSNQIPRLSTTDTRTYAGGMVHKPDTSTLHCTTHRKSNLKLEDGRQTHTSTTLQTLKLGGTNGTIAKPFKSQ